MRATDTLHRQASLSTDRLTLRPLTLADAADVQRMAGERDIADMTRIPHPYEDGVAEEWIRSTHAEFEKEEGATFAITLREEGSLIGVIGLGSKDAQGAAELGYWVGKSYWNRGYCTEAARAVLAYGFQELCLNRIYAYHFKRNPASGRVMQKIGMQHEGDYPKEARKCGIFEDLVLYGILKSDFGTI